MQKEEEEEGTDGERGEGWVKEEGETGDRGKREMGWRRWKGGFIQAPFPQHGTYSSQLNLPQFLWYFGTTLLLG